MELAQKSLIHLTKGLRDWSQNWREISPELHSGHLMLIRIALEEGVKPPGNLYDLLLMLQSPCREWGISAFQTIFDPEATIIDKFNGLSNDAEEFLEEHISIEESEQRVMLKILQHCRNKFREEARYDELYRNIRAFVTLPEHAILPAGEIYDFASSLHDLELHQLFLSLYEEVPLPYDNYYYCPYCGWTLSFNHGKILCTNRTCHLKGEFRNLAKVTNDSQDILWRLTSGIQRYVLVPGITEQALYQHLRSKKFDVQLYPEVDRYDLRVRLGSEIIDLDVKEYYSVRNLADYLNQNWQKFHENSYIVIPNHVSKEKTFFLQEIKTKLSQEARQQITIIPESKIMSVLVGGGE